MVSLIHQSWREQFARASRWERERDRLLHEQFRRDMEDARQQRTEANHDAADLVLEMALASPASVAEFRVRLDRYDEATVAALMKNDEALTDVRRNLASMFERAHVLPDGRRVFRTRDGLLVFDEHGNQVGIEVIDPSEISGTRPVWEDVTAARELEGRLIQERTELLRFQERIDAARERLDDKDLTQQELDELREDLEQSAPTAVLREMPGYIERTTSAPGEQFDVRADRTPVSAVASVRSFDHLAP